MKPCWICGTLADSREHKIKKSTLRALYGRGPYIGSNGLYHAKDGTIAVVQGPNANRLKYSPVICAACNNSRTQLADEAFEFLVDYWLHFRAEIEASRVLDLCRIFPQSSDVMSAELFRFFAKHLGCDLAESMFTVPQDLVLIAGGTFVTSRLQVSFALDRDPIDVPIPVERTAGIGTLLTTVRNLKSRDDPRYIWSSHVGALRMFYWYDCRPDPQLGASWAGACAKVAVGMVTPESNPRDASFIKPA